MHSGEEHLTLIESVIEGLTHAFNAFSEEHLEDIRMLEIEKNYLKAELGSRKTVRMREECDASTAW